MGIRNWIKFLKVKVLPSCTMDHSTDRGIIKWWQVQTAHKAAVQKRNKRLFATAFLLNDSAKVIVKQSHSNQEALRDKIKELLGDQVRWLTEYLKLATKEVLQD